MHYPQQSESQNSLIEKGNTHYVITDSNKLNEFLIQIQYCKKHFLNESDLKNNNINDNCYLEKSIFNDEAMGVPSSLKTMN